MEVIPIRKEISNYGGNSDQESGTGEKDIPFAVGRRVILSSWVKNWPELAFITP